MKFDPVSVATLVTAVVAFGGWVRSELRLRKASGRGSLDILIEALQQAAKDNNEYRDGAERRTIENLNRALGCEEREDNLIREMRTLERKNSRLEDRILRLENGGGPLGAGTQDSS